MEKLMFITRISWFILLAILLSFKAFAKLEVIWINDDSREIEHLYLDTHLNITTDSLKLLLTGMEEFDIEFKEALLPRAKKLVFTKDNVCGVNWVKTKERESKSIYSLPFTIYPGLRLYYLDEFSKLPESLINNQEQLSSLPALLKLSPGALIATVKGRSYGTFIDKQLSLLDKGSIYARSAEEPYRSLESMLIKNRINYLIEFPSEMSKFEAKYNVDGLLRSIEIEGDNRYLVGHIVCSKSIMGKQVISAVNKRLREIYNTKDHIKAHLRHIPPFVRSSFIDYYQEIISKAQ
jgi:uncharacterized protein (TIGR02285 family)